MYLFQPAYIPPFWQLKSELNIFNTNIKKTETTNELEIFFRILCVFLLKKYFILRAQHTSMCNRVPLNWLFSNCMGYPYKWCNVYGLSILWLAIMS